MAWLNWPQMCSGCQVIGAPRTRRGARHASVQPLAFEGLGARLVLEQDPAADALPVGPAARRASQDRQRVIDARSDRRAATPRRPDDEPAMSPSLASRTRVPSAPPNAVEDERGGPRRSPRDRGRPSRRGRPDGTDGPRASSAAAAEARAPPSSDTRSGPRTRAARRAAGPVRGDEDERPATRRVGGVDRPPLGQRGPEPAPRRCAGATQIVPIQPTGPLIVATPVPTTSPSASATNE